MADAGAAPGVAVPGTTGTAGNQSGTGTGPTNTHPEAKPGETKQQTLQRIRMDLGDGEQEYDPAHVQGLAQRGRKAAQTLSKAEQRAQEALKAKQETEARLSRLKSKDLRELRATLKELGVDEMALATHVAQEFTESEKLSPEQKRIRELEQQVAAREEAERKAKDEEGKKAEQAEQARYEQELSDLFVDVMKRTGLPQDSNRVVFHRLAALYQAAEVAGTEVDPDLAAEKIKHAIRAEHTALFKKKDGTLDLDAFEAHLGPEDWKAINRRAVEKFRASKGMQAAPAQQTQAAPAPEAKTNGRSVNFWKTLKTM